MEMSTGDKRRVEKTVERPDFLIFIFYMILLENPTENCIGVL